VHILKASSSHGGDYKDCSRLGCDAGYSVISVPNVAEVSCDAVIN